MREQRSDVLRPAPQPALSKRPINPHGGALKLPTPALCDSPATLSDSSIGRVARVERLMGFRSSMTTMETMRPTRIRPLLIAVLALAAFAIPAAAHAASAPKRFQAVTVTRYL